MIFNNTWINHEDDLFLRYTSIIELPSDSYLELIHEINKSFHNLTYKHKLLMTLSPEYCDYFGIDYIDHYITFLEENRNNPTFFLTEGYEFYTKNNRRSSKIFFKNESGILTSSHVHYILNDSMGNPQMLLNDLNIRNSMDIEMNREEFPYEAIPLSILRPTYLKENISKNTITASFSIESHCSFWLDSIPLFKFYDKNNNLQYLEHSNNKDISYANTPRLNSFLRDLTAIIKEYGGYSELYDYESLLSSDHENKNSEAMERKGLKLDGKIIYQEDIDEGNINMETFEWIGSEIESNNKKEEDS